MGCGSKVTATTGSALAPIEPASSRARAMTCRWPRCTPSKLPIVTTHGPTIGSEEAPGTARQIITDKLCHANENAFHAGRIICTNRDREALNSEQRSQRCENSFADMLDDRALRPLRTRKFLRIGAIGSEDPFHLTGEVVIDNLEIDFVVAGEEQTTGTAKIDRI